MIDYTIQNTKSKIQFHDCTQNLKKRRRETAHLQHPTIHEGVVKSNNVSNIQENVGADKVQAPSVAKSMACMKNKHKGSPKAAARAYDGEILCKLGQHLIVHHEKEEGDKSIILEMGSFQ